VSGVCRWSDVLTILIASPSNLAFRKLFNRRTKSFRSLTLTSVNTASSADYISPASDFSPPAAPAILLCGTSPSPPLFTSNHFNCKDIQGRGVCLGCADRLFEITRSATSSVINEMIPSEMTQ
jgi:hypothetical protein